jgi:light-regulated signal transduction histidine kinase (bacteriophytochrome)
VVVDSQLKVRLANHFFRDTFGLSREQLENAFLPELNHGAWLKTDLEPFVLNILSEDSPADDLYLDFEFTPGHRRTFALSARAVVGGNNSARLVLLIPKDVTEQRITDHARELHTADLERSNSDLEQFAYVASHDLQEPLRMVASFTQLLGQRYRGKLDADADEFIAYAVDGAHRMQVLINDLLVYSRVGRKDLDQQPTDCMQILELVEKDLQSAIEESGAEITFSTLPIVRVDPRQIRQVFQNLLANALKFRGTHAPRIIVSASKAGAEWVFSIQDNGIGIAPDQCRRIFEIFQRLHSRAEYPGTGIGLAICKKIIERHGGRIWAQSEPGSGTTFFFTLPQTPRRKA